MQKFIIVILCLIGGFQQQSNAQWNHGRLQVSPNGHYLQYQDGTPFFWLGDTAWELFHRLNLKEIDQYLTNRQAQGFNVIQAVLLAEFDGLRKPNQNGDLPLTNMDPAKPNEPYFKFADSVIDLAKTRGLYMGLLPTWGDKVLKMWGEGPQVFNPQNAYAYGLYLGKRYAAYPNIIWILGGDRPAVTDTLDTRPVWRAMAKGIKEGTGGRAIFSYHISGGPRSTSQQIHNEDWLDINMMQSGHGSGHDVPVWDWITRDRVLNPTKPTLDSEPNYEDHPVNPWPTWDPKNGYFDDYDVRKQTYRSVFAGACGVTYGHHSIWQFYNPREAVINHAKMYWTEAMNRPGATQMHFLKNLILSRPSLTRIPDQSIIVNGKGEKGGYCTAYRDSASTFAMVYIAEGKDITIQTPFLAGKKTNAWWFRPADGKVTKAVSVPVTNGLKFTPPTLGKTNDWVLIADDAAKHYKKPGSI